MLKACNLSLLRKNDSYCQFSVSIPFLEILLIELKKLLEIYC